jgi:hypothetical protein
MIEECYGVVKDATGELEVDSVDDGDDKACSVFCVCPDMEDADRLAFEPGCHVEPFVIVSRAEWEQLNKEKRDERS